MEYFQYYGIDWVALVLTFLAIWQIGNKNKIGFILMMCGNTSWIAVGYLTGSVAMIIANIIFFSMNLRAIIKWSTPEKEPKVSVAEQSSTS
ncbi:PnuC protein [Vibrio parahaemolyticus]|uniref:nicotinamide mononucleotide transporter n=1 Tax=Vibrio parahaemolyticus TaxID=670 RepID=UPI00112388AE|nr:nicotinamide mononucleotide transporter [Vibrio parahaemolyticus]TOG29926.1 PnuC protein [Vibrio parahaemolyticus]